MLPDDNEENKIGTVVTPTNTESTEGLNTASSSQPLPSPSIVSPQVEGGAQTQKPEPHPVLNTPVVQPSLQNKPLDDQPVLSVGLPRPSKKTKLKSILLVIILIVLVAAAGAAGYYFGKKNAPAPKNSAVSVKTTQAITLPPEATVTAECTTGRGKQYILPKDIPAGPIYNVNNGKVIAIEYLITTADLLSKPDTFTDKMNLLMKNYSVDHFTLVPTMPHAGETQQHVHLIMFVVPKEEAASIVCDSSSSADTMNMDMSHTTH